MERSEAVLDFWFTGKDSRVWFSADDAFDRACRLGFVADHERAVAGELNEWTSTPRSALALILLLDQLPRNMFRGTARAFASDRQAREVARQVVARGFDQLLPPTQRAFVYMPFEHSEDLGDQDESVRLFRKLAADSASDDGDLRYANEHREIIERFGRFPARNAILGRESTPEEIAFLAGDEERRS